MVKWERDLPVSRRSGGHDLEFSVFVESHRNAYHFDYLVPLYGARLAKQIASAWPRVCLLQAPATTQDRFHALRILLSGSHAIALEHPNSRVSQFVSSLQSRSLKKVPADLLQAAAEAVASKLRDVEDFDFTSSKLKKTRTSLIGNLSGLLQRLGEAGELPPIPRLRGAGGNDNFLARRPSLGELSKRGAAAAPCASPSLDDHVETMLMACEERLRALRDCLVHEFESEWAAFQQGAQWLADAKLPSSADVLAAARGLSELENMAARRSTLAARLRARFGPDPLLFEALAVRFVIEVQDGIVTTTNQSIATRCLIALAGGPNRVARYLEANVVATNAVFTIVLCDTAMNIAPASLLPADPFISEVRRGTRRIATLASHKMRAQGKAVHSALIDEGEADLPIRDRHNAVSCLSVIERYKTMVEPLRKRALKQGSQCSGLLFLHTYGTSANAGRIVSDPGDGFAGYVWPDFLKRHANHPLIGELPITRAMIRTTALILRSGRSDFSTAPAQALAEHKRARTTGGYLDAPFMRKQIAEQMRSFLDLFEAALAFDVPNASWLTRTSEGTLDERLLIAIDTGLSFACADRIPPLQLAPPTPSCTPLDPCDACPVRKLVPDRRGLLSLHMAHRALSEAEKEFLAKNPARWAKFWLPWRALTEAYVLKVKSSPHSRLFREIVQAGNEMIAGGKLSLPIVR